MFKQIGDTSFPLKYVTRTTEVAMDGIYPTVPGTELLLKEVNQLTKIISDGRYITDKKCTGVLTPRSDTGVCPAPRISTWTVHFYVPGAVPLLSQQRSDRRTVFQVLVAVQTLWLRDRQQLRITHLLMWTCPKHLKSGKVMILLMPIHQRN